MKQSLSDVWFLYIYRLREDLIDVFNPSEACVAVCQKEKQSKLHLISIQNWSSICVVVSVYSWYQVVKRSKHTCFAVGGSLNLTVCESSQEGGSTLNKEVNYCFSPEFIIKWFRDFLWKLPGRMKYREKKLLTPSSFLFSFFSTDVGRNRDWAEQLHLYVLWMPHLSSDGFVTV